MDLIHEIFVKQFKSFHARKVSHLFINVDINSQYLYCVLLYLFACNMNAFFSFDFLFIVFIPDCNEL